MKNLLTIFLLALANLLQGQSFTIQNDYLGYQGSSFNGERRSIESKLGYFSVNQPVQENFVVLRGTDGVLYMFKQTSSSYWLLVLNTASAPQSLPLKKRNILRIFEDETYKTVTLH